MAPREVGSRYGLLCLLIILSYPPPTGNGMPFLGIIVSFCPYFPGEAPLAPIHIGHVTQAGPIRALFEIRKRGIKRSPF